MTDQEVNSLLRELEVIKVELDSARTSRNDLCDSLAQRNSELQEAQLRYNVAESKLTHEQEKNAALLHKNAELVAALNAANVRATALADDNQQLSDDAENMSGQIFKLRQEFVAATANSNAVLEQFIKDLRVSQTQHENDAMVAKALAAECDILAARAERLSRKEA